MIQDTNEDALDSLFTSLSNLPDNEDTLAAVYHADLIRKNQLARNTVMRKNVSFGRTSYHETGSFGEDDPADIRHYHKD